MWTTHSPFLSFGWIWYPFRVTNAENILWDTERFLCYFLRIAHLIFTSAVAVGNTVVTCKQSPRSNGSWWDFQKYLTELADFNTCRCPLIQALCRRFQPYSSTTWAYAPYCMSSRTISRCPPSTAQCNAVLQGRRKTIGHNAYKYLFCNADKTFQV